VDDNIAIFMVLIVSIAAALILVLSSAWMKRSGALAAAAHGGEDVAHLSQENDMLREQVRRLEQQLGLVDQVPAGTTQWTRQETEMLR
jgi:hypothetical protein